MEWERFTNKMRLEQRPEGSEWWWQEMRAGKELWGRVGTDRGDFNNLGCIRII